MYTPSHFAAPSQEALYQLMREYPLATLVMLGPEGLEANHIPLHLSAEGVLRGHVARANLLWQSYAPGKEVLAIFHGPQAYVSPSWYASKKQHGKVVPTWNYAVVHAHGRLQVRDDPAWVRKQIEALTAEHEGRLPQPWAVQDAPPDYIEDLLKAVVGIEIEVTRLNGKWKMSQNQPPENQAGVVAGLASIGQAATAAWVKPK